MTHDVEVLILTSDLDFATDRICRELRRRQVSFLRLNRETLTDVALTLDPLAPELICRRGDERWVVGSKLRTVWWRQGTFDRNILDRGFSIEQQLQRSQWPAFMRSMMAFAEARWINHPSAVYRAETKAVQLGTARKLGFKVPSTLMTNDPDAPVVRSVGGEVAIKSLDTLLLREGSEQLFGYTTITRWAEIAKDHLHQAPITAQAALRNKRDLRITVLDDQAWCVEITKNGAPVEGDWRLIAKDSIRITDCVLPTDEFDRCIQLVRDLGLIYGAIDMAKIDEEYWFIEINPTGEWGWLDNPERPLASTIADHLACRP